MPSLEKNTPARNYRNDWRRGRLEILKHIINSDSWHDIMIGVNALSKVNRNAESLIKELERNDLDCNPESEVVPQEGELK